MRLRGPSVALVSCLLIGANLPAQQSTPAATLLERAQQLDASGRPDLAAQDWRQVLLSDPSNRSALEGLLRYDWQSGDTRQAAEMSKRLRRVDPKDPLLTMSASATAKHAGPPQQDARLTSALQAASRGDNGKAFQLYLDVFGNQPPTAWAVAYYRTEASVPGHAADAVAGLHRFAGQFPMDASFAIALGQVLTFRPATRVRGASILAQYAPTHPEADRALRQSLLWGVASPQMAPAIASYLKTHPDPILAAAFAHAQSEQTSSYEEAFSYRALQQKNLPLAERSFRQILLHHPGNAPALAGMGFLFMQRQDFSTAIHWLQLAEQHGARDAGIRQAMIASQFWLHRNAASVAFAHHKMQDAEAEVQIALRIGPENSNAILELAQVMEATGRPAGAIRLYRHVLVKTPTSVEAWSGWLTASIPLHQAAAVIQAEQQLPPAISLQLLNDPAFLSSLAQAYVATGQQGRAEELLAHALHLSPPAITTEQRQQIALQYAALCVEDRHYDQASRTYRGVLNGNSDNLPSWQGIVLTEHLLGQDHAALDTVKQMPAGVHAVLMQIASFVMLLAGVDQSLGKFNAAEGLLLQAQSELQMKGQPPSISLLQQMAGLNLQMHQPKAAVLLYRQALAHPSQSSDVQDVHSWIGLLSALHQAGKDRQAIEAQETMQPAAYRRMLQNPASFASDLETYFSTMAGAEQSLGNLQAALSWLEQLDAVDRTRHTTPPTEPPIDMELQEAWLQYNLNRNQAAQDSLLRLRNHLHALGHTHPDQAKQMADLTANLAVRRAAQLTAQGDRQQALQVLNTASQQVEGASAARTRLAAGYLTAGQPATAVAIYQSVDMRAATVGDLRAAVGAAMETRQTDLAQEWLQLALTSHPDDPGLLLLAGEFAQSNDNLPLAEQYLRTSLLAAKKTSSANASQQLAVQQQATERLDEIEASYSGWLGGTGYLSHFSGTPGITQLTDVEIPVEASTPIGDRARVTAVARPVYLNSGSYAGVAGQPLGTLTTNMHAPAVPMTGVGGSIQVATRNLAASLGSTPSGFPVMNLTAAGMFHVPHNPWTLSFSRDSIRESQLSYAGLHDPANTSNVWGGVVANAGTVQYARGNSQAGWYATASAGVVTGRHVAANPQFTADAGEYRQVWARTEVSLRVGINFYAQHNTRNELLFTYGHGGYFSPEYYFLPAVPLTLSGSSARRFHYEFSGSMGPQIFRQASALYFPLDASLQAARGNQIYPAQSTVSLNYGAGGKAAYLVGEHFRFEGFFSLNNADNYNQQIVGLSLHYLFRRQRFSRTHPAGWFPYSGLRPYPVP